VRTANTKILNATYGAGDNREDVAHIVSRECGRGGIMHFEVTTGFFEIADPAPNTVKELIVSIEEEDGSVKEVKVAEHQKLIYPDERDDVDKVVLFYSHINPETDPKQASFVKYCLEDLLSRVDDRTVVRGGLIHDYHIDHPRFHNYEPLYREGQGHAMITSQILRPLYAMKDAGYSPKYVMFAEHDCLYPEEHFKFEDFEEDILVNVNHVGFTSDGFQGRQGQVTWPTLSMAMKYDYALEYFMRRLEHMFLNPSKYALIEPMTEQWLNEDNLNQWTEWTRDGLAATTKVRETQAPILHMWNGCHATSHYQSYPKDYYAPFNDYWGSAEALAHSYYGSYLSTIPKIPD